MSDDATDGIAYLEVPIAITGCIIYIFVAIAIHHYKETYHHMPWIHESSVACLIGVFMGAIIKYSTGVPVVFDGNLFFYLVLPPVIFSAGYSLKRKNFFKYIDLITFFGVVGTIINFMVITAGAYAYGRVLGGPNCYKLSWNEALIFSAVLTGSDEVSARSLVRIKDFPRMGALIFGEGVVNDAMSIVLFKTFLPMYNDEDAHISLQSKLQYPAPSTLSIVQSIMVQIVCSMLIGLCCGLVHARLMRSLPMIRHFPVYQTALVMLFGYVSYCIAEGVGISGILTVFIAAVSLAHYSWYNLSSSAQIATRISFAGISEIAEGFAFSYVGLSLWVYENDQINFVFSFYMLVVVIVARLVTVLGLFKICSFCLPSFRVPMSEQLGFMLGGVVRGCLSWAQILQIKHSPVLITTTLIIVITTSLGSGVLLPILLPMLTPMPVQPNTTNKTVGSDIESESGTGQEGYKESDIVSLRRGPFSTLDNIKNHNNTHGSNGCIAGTAVTPLRTSSSAKAEEDSTPLQTPERAYHFAYQPFSADFSNTVTKDTTRIRSPRSQTHANTTHFKNTNYGGNQYPNLDGDGDTLSPNPLDDLRSNEELIALISSREAALQPSIVSMLFWQWVRFDETFMKPLFGGSDRRYRLLQERSRQESAMDVEELESQSQLTLSTKRSVLDHPNTSRVAADARPRYGSTDNTGKSDTAGAGAAKAGGKRQSAPVIQQTPPKMAPKVAPKSAVGSNASHSAPSVTAPVTATDILSDLFVSPGGRAYVLEEDREDEIELERMADQLCLLDREMDDREG